MRALVQLLAEIPKRLRGVYATERLRTDFRDFLSPIADYVVDSCHLVDNK